MGLFEEQKARKPNKYIWTKDFIKAVHNSFWTADEFDFRSDVSQFHSVIGNQEQEVITRTLASIGQVEIAVKRFWANLGDNLPHPSIYDLGYVMANTEVIHNEAYEKLLDVLGLGHIFELHLQNPVLEGRMNYLRKYLQRYSEDERQQFIYSIILFTLFIENVSLFSQFYILLWFNRTKNYLKDTAQQIQYTRNEEMLHALAGTQVINTLRAEYPELFTAELEERVREEANVALVQEAKLIDWIMQDYDQTDGLNAWSLMRFVGSRIDDSLKMIGFEPIWNEPAPPETNWFNEELFGYNLTDFFAKKPVDYSKRDKNYDNIF